MFPHQWCLIARGGIPVGDWRTPAQGLCDVLSDRYVAVEQEYAVEKCKKQTSSIVPVPAASMKTRKQDESNVLNESDVPGVLGGGSVKCQLP